MLLLTAELGARVATWALARRALAAHPTIAQRVRGGGPRLTPEVLLDLPEAFPAPIHRPDAAPGTGPEWSTFGALDASAFRTPPRAELPAPGVVRIAFVGGSTTFDGYPEEVGHVLEAALGAGRVEIVNLGVPASHSGTNLLLMRRFLPRWAPHLVVLYDGFNDLVYYRARAQVLYALVTHQERAMAGPLGGEPASVGLLGLVRRATDRPLREDHWLGSSVFDEPRVNQIEMAHLAWSLGAELFVTTFARPADPTLPADELAFYAADLRFLWPMLGTPEKYAADLDRYNRELAGSARALGVTVIDLAARLGGGREHFRDNCHRTEVGDRLHAELTASALRPRVEALLAQGAPRPIPRIPSASAPRPVPPSGLPTAHARDGRCESAPCPPGACFVPAGPATWGYPPAVLDRALADALAEYGVGAPNWYEDDGPPNTVELSAFCIDRDEAQGAEHAACVAAGRCPPAEARAGAPAVLRTAIEAEAYCGSRGGRLPTDAEWEAAARGGDARLMPWGDAPWTGKEANFRGRLDGHEGAAPPASFPAGGGPYGLRDAAGNLWEWVLDCFATSARRDTPSGSRDPLVSGLRPCRRVLRGGGYTALGSFLERRTPDGFGDVVPESRGVRCAYDFGTRHQVVPLGHR
ncbi:MAG: SUMF1/EgtB/PvdO family nonheme iron enzyme [Polyangiaceae bacterium]|nr:SUMF1/EgtB/PvdO family nonheme iron enzyme [Polyangiaceae bacterium]